MASNKRRRQRTNRAQLRESTGTATTTRVRGDLVAVDEATLRSDGTVPIRLISPGWGSSGYYSPDVLEAAGTDAVFPAGTPMFWDHPTISERHERPERSLRDLAAVTETDATWRPDHPDGPGLYAEARIFQPYRELLAEMAPHIGVSIRAGAQVSTGEAEGRRGRIIERIVEGQSVDFVTRPGRGGQVLAVLEAAGRAGATEALWSDERRQRLRQALQDRFPSDGYLWVRDFTDDEVVFELDGEQDGLDAGTYQLGYTLGADDEVTLADDDPVRVEVRTTYEPATEARNVGEWFQSRIHLHFTTLADDMFGDGRLTKDERITLSSGIGAALDAFSALVGDEAPQLLTRDLWDEPAATQPIESQEDRDMPITQEERAAIAAEAATAVVTQLTEAGIIPPPGSDTDVDEAQRELTEARTEAARLREAALVRDARDAVTEQVNAVAGLPAPTRARLVEQLQQNPPVTEAGALDTQALTSRVTEAVQAEVTYLAEATGSPIRGAGGGGPDPESAETTGALEAAFGRFGLSESAAKVAAAGRR